MGLACNGHKSGGRRGIEPHDDQRPVPRFLVPGFLYDGVVGVCSSILGVDHIEMATLISPNPDLATPNALPSAGEGLEGFQLRVFSRIVQT